jgi:hypothetical protein
MIETASWVTTEVSLAATPSDPAFLFFYSETMTDPGDFILKI